MALDDDVAPVDAPVACVGICQEGVEELPINDTTTYDNGVKVVTDLKSFLYLIPSGSRPSAPSTTNGMNTLGGQR